MNSKNLREKRAALIEEARAVLPNDGEAISDDANNVFDVKMAEADKLMSEIEKIERLESAERDLEERIEAKAGREGISKDEAQAKDMKDSEVFAKYMVAGISGLSNDEKQFMASRHTQIQGALTTGTDSSGGYTIPEGFRSKLEVAMKAFGGVRGVATVLATDTGNTIPMPTANDTNQEGELIGENTQVNEQDVAFGSVNIDAYTYSSKAIRVPYQLLQDTGIDLESYLADALATRLGRITNKHFTLGDGSSKPTGIVTASAVGHTAASNSAITYDDLLDLEHSVDYAYRKNAGTGFMFSDSTLKVLKKLKDSEGRPLWLPGIAVGEPDTILGHKFTINHDMEDIGADAKAVLFGDLKKYLIRDVKGVTLNRLTERYADYMQVGFLGYQRADGALLDAGANPVKHLVMAS